MEKKKGTKVLLDIVQFMVYTIYQAACIHRATRIPNLVFAAVKHYDIEHRTILNVKTEIAIKIHAETI